MNKKMKFVSLLLSLILIISTFLPNMAIAERNQDFDYSYQLDEEPLVEELPQELQELEEEIGSYLDSFDYTEEEFESMSDEEFEEVYNEIFNNEEFLHLEQQYEEQYTQFENDLNGDAIQPYVAPILVPIAAAAARVALQTIVKHGTKVASKYLKNKLKSVGKNYKLIWNSKNKNGKITSLLKIQNKKTKQIIFRIDNGTIPLKPGSSKWYWHYHIANGKNGMKHHYSLRSLVPSKHKPDTRTTLY